MPPPAPESSGTPVAEHWASLPADLIRLVSSRVLAGDLLDYVRFRSVCGSWRSATLCPRGRGVVDPRFHPRRWTMLPEGHGLHPGHPRLRGYIRFLNLDTGAFVRAHLPLFRAHRGVDSVDGLLVLVRDRDSAVRLLHPFTGDVADLPPLATVLPQLEGTALDRVPAPDRIGWLAESICASVSFSGGVITVMLALHEVDRVAVATALDQQWTLSTWLYQSAAPPLAFQGKLYTTFDVSYSCKSEFTGEWENYGDVQVYQIDPPVNDGMGGAGSELPEPKLIATLPEGNLDISMGLVECDSEILVVGYKDWDMTQFAVFKLTDLIQQRYTPITSIGGNTLFIRDRNLSVAPTALPTPVGDSVVCLEPRRYNLVHQQLTGGSWSPAADDCSLFDPAPVGPCSIIHHIFSCCIRVRCNKGLVFG